MWSSEVSDVNSTFVGNPGRDPRSAFSPRQNPSSDVDAQLGGGGHVVVNEEFGSDSPVWSRSR